MIRVASKRDAAAMLAIYAPFVSDTSVSFEYEAPSLEEFGRRIQDISAKYPWLVWEQDGEVLGYAYASAAFQRAAYQWCADMTIYLSPAARRTGIGHALYSRLEAIMEALGYRWLYAIVVATNADSCRFHERRGYELLGVLKRCGWKQGKWHDINWYGLRIGGDEPPEGPPRRFDPSML